MRLMSFYHTIAQVKAGTKTETRRLGWHSLQPGTYLRAVNKCQGLKTDEHPETLAIIRVDSISVQRLNQSTKPA